MNLFLLPEVSYVAQTAIDTYIHKPSVAFIPCTEYSYGMFSAILILIYSLSQDRRIAFKRGIRIGLPRTMY